ncbi:MAG TPA: metal-dependent transcriptional regulator [Gemmatimonadales bacterium]|nr:metal-dependent transcriptional regulator [Gemmatimonadales bacterium]
MNAPPNPPAPPAPRAPEPQLTRSVEDYLKSVFHLTNQGGFATTSDIAEMLAVAPPSVSGMMKRLSETGLIEHVPYRGVQLTPQGRRAALQMIRRHRILESYLTSKLGYDWGDVHVEAERLEHAVSEKLIERMADALGEPRYDPHGAPIPTAAGEIEETELLTLAETAVGATVILQEVGDENPARLHYLAEQGLTPGVRLSLIDRQPFNGPTIVRLDEGMTRVVGQELALLLFCRPVGGPDGE